MSEQNVLNPTQTSLFNPDWGYTEGLPELRSVFQAQSGTIFSRIQQGLGRIYDLGWNNRDLATKLTLQQWENQYRDDYFSFADWEMQTAGTPRYITGRFDGPLTYSPSGNQKYNIKARFVELPGKPMFAYPTNWARDAAFMEERNSAAEDLVKLTGTWNGIETDARDHGGQAYFGNSTNATAEWIYFGYGFRFWSTKRNNAGIVEITVTRVRDGLVMAGPGNVDLYSAAGAVSAPLLTCAVVGADSATFSCPLDLYRVKLRVTGTKNAASSDFHCFPDAIEVMR